MSLFTVDTEKCVRDGICAAECPIGIIAFDGKTVPEPCRDAEQMCINCGHCVAVCPTGALSLKNMPAEQCPPVRKELALNAEQAGHFLRARRSIRVYKEKTVDRDTLSNLIQIAGFAPSGHNGQPVHWLAVHDTAEVRKMTAQVADWMRHMTAEKNPLAGPLHLERVVTAWDKGKDAICRNAPHLIIAHAPKADGSAPAACTIALTYLELAAAPLGLGACWAGYFNLAANLWPPLQATLALPKGNVSFGAMMIGYPKFKYHRLPLRKEPDIMWR